MELQIPVSLQSVPIPLSLEIAGENVEEEADELPAPSNNSGSEPAPIPRLVPDATRNEQQLREFVLYLDVLDVDYAGWEPASTRWTTLQVEVCGDCQTRSLPSATRGTNTNALKTGPSAGTSATEFHFVLQDYFAPTKVAVRILSSTLFSRSVVAERVVTLRDLLLLPRIEQTDTSSSSSSTNTASASRTRRTSHTSMNAPQGCARRWGGYVRLSLPVSRTVSGFAKGKEPRQGMGLGAARPPTPSHPATGGGGGGGGGGGVVNMWLLESAKGAASMSSQLVELPLPRSSPAAGLELVHAKPRSLAAYTALPERDRAASVLIKAGGNGDGNGNGNGSEGGGGSSPASASLRSVIVIDADDDECEAARGFSPLMNVDKKPASLATTSAAVRGMALTLQMRVVTLQGCVQLVDDQCEMNKGARAKRIADGSSSGSGGSSSSGGVYRRSELHALAAHGSAAVVAHLLATLAKSRGPTAPDHAPASAQGPQVSVVRRALALRDSEDRRPLDVALRHGNLPVVRVLLQRVGHLCFEGQQWGMGTGTGAGMEVPGSTALHHAVAGGDVACVQLLVKFLRKYAATLTTGLMGAGMAYHPQLQTHAAQAQRLSLPTMLEARNLLDDTPLMAALDAVAESTAHAPSTLASNSAAASAVTSSSSPPPSASVLEIVRVLVQAGADVAAVNRHSLLTPFMLAARGGHLEVAEYLLSVAVPRREAVRALTEVAAVVRYFSRTRGNQTQAQTLASAPAPSSSSAPPQTQAAVSTSSAANNGPPNSQGGPPSVSRGGSRTVTSIDELLPPLTLYKCRPYLKDCRGCDALMLAAEAGHVSVVDTCLRIGLDAAGGQDVTLLTGETALHLAARGGHLAVCELLAAAERIAWRAHRDAVAAQAFSGRPRKPRLLTGLSGGGKRPAELARAAGHTDVALRLEALALDIYGDGADEGVVPRCDEGGAGGKSAGASGHDHDHDHDCVHDDAADEVEHRFALAPAASRSRDSAGYCDATPPSAARAAVAPPQPPSPADPLATVAVTAAADAAAPPVVGFAVAAADGAALSSEGVKAETLSEGSTGPCLTTSLDDSANNNDGSKPGLDAPLLVPVPAPAPSIDATVSPKAVPLGETETESQGGATSLGDDDHSTKEDRGLTSTSTSTSSTVIAPMLGDRSSETREQLI